MHRLNVPQLIDWVWNIAEGEGRPTAEDVAAEPDPELQELIAGIVSARQDVADALEAARRSAELAQQEAGKLAAVLDAVVEGLILTLPDGEVVWANAAAHQALMVAPGRLVGEMLGVPMGKARIRPLGHGEPGRVVELVSNRVDWAGQDLRLLTVQDIASRDELERRALYDSLTGLPNRALLMGRLAHELKRLSREDGGLAVLFLDLDQFKRVNDTYGHSIGDLLLKETASRLTAQTRPGDTVARLAGDEFVLILPGISGPDDCLPPIQRVLESLGELYELGPVTLNSYASVGVRYVTAAMDAERLLSEADAAMYAAKQNKTGSYVFFAPEMLSEAKTRFEIGQALHGAFKDRQLELHYQPVVSAEGRLEGFEALMRWPAGDPESLTPSQFIRSAEDSGLILELGAWALEQACGVLSGWRRRGGRWQDLRMSVNVSSVQLNDPEFGGRVAAALEAADLPAQALGLEFTETALMRGGSHALRQIEGIAATGVEILIDDFGTGYATLSYLKWARANTLKIDRSFIVGLGADPVDLAIVRSQVALADELGMSSVAEGVESRAQFDELRRLGCRRFQGYLFGRAQPASVIDEHFEKWPLTASLLDHPIPDSSQTTASAPERAQVEDPAS